ncbi:hypothetical protein HCC30_12185 [Streptomyces sp. HNM0574]|nr:hypothetical protein [Streptomyces sp. HNM0574]
MTQPHGGGPHPPRTPYTPYDPHAQHAPRGQVREQPPVPEQAQAPAPASAQIPAPSPAPEAATPAPEGGRRARRSPLIAPGLLPAAVTTVLAALIAGAAPLGDVPLAVAVLLLQGLTAAGWFRLNGMWPARQGIALAFLSGVAADVGLLLTGGDHAPGIAIGTLGVWCVLTLVLHLRNRQGPDERLYALTAALTATALTVLAAGQLAALPAAGAEAVIVGCAAVAAATLVRALPLPPYVSPLLAAAAAAGAGVGAGNLAGLADQATGTGALGLAAGVCALIGLRVASYDFPSRFVHMTAGVALPLALAAPVVHVLGRALV